MNTVVVLQRFLDRKIVTEREKDLAVPVTFPVEENRCVPASHVHTNRQKIADGQLQQ
jgi:hypothetical protein